MSYDVNLLIQVAENKVRPEDRSDAIVQTGSDLIQNYYDEFATSRLGTKFEDITHGYDVRKIKNDKIYITDQKLKIKDSFEMGDLNDEYNAIQQYMFNNGLER